MTDTAYTEWPTFKGTARRTSSHDNGDEETPGVNGGDLAAVWTADAREVDATPAVVGDRVVAGSNPVAAYRLEDGEQVWTADLSRDGSPVAAEGTVVVANHDGEVVALDVETGLEQWTFDPGWVNATPTIADGKVLVPSRQEVIAVGLDDGEELWRASGYDRQVSHAPVVADGTVVVGSENGDVMGADLETGQQEWLDDDLSNGRVEHAPAALANMVFVPAGGSLTCYDADTGERRWEFSDHNVGTPAIADRTIFVAGDRTLYALDGTGRENWSVEFEYGIRNPSPAVVDDTVVVGYQDELYGYDVDSGEEVFAYPADGEVMSVPVGAYGAALVGLRSEGLAALLPHGESIAVPEDARVGESDSADVSAVADDGWSTARCTPSRTGALPDASGPTETPGDARWTYGTSAVPGASLDGEGTAYVLSPGDGLVAAVDVETGIASWEFDAGERLVGEPVVADGTVYVCDDYGVLYALDAEDGTEQWQFEGDGSFPRIEGSVTVADGTVYAPTDGGAVYAIDAETGTTEWAFEKREGFQRGAIVTDETVIAPNRDGSVYGIDRERAEQRWATETPGVGGPGDVAAGQGLVFVGSGDGDLLALDPETGVEQWSAELEGDLAGEPTVGEEHVFAGVEDRGKALVAFDVDSGEEAWSASFSREVGAGPALADGVVYAAAGQSVHGVEADSGRELFAMEAYGYDMAPVVGDGFVLFSGDDVVGLYDGQSRGADEEGVADDLETVTEGSQAGGPGAPPDETFRSIAAEEVADDPTDPDDDAVRATALGVLVDAWHEEFDRDARLDFDTMLEFVTEELPGVSEQVLEFNLDALDGNGAIDFEPAFKSSTLRARGLDHYFEYTGEKPVPDRDLLGVLQPLYNAYREGDSLRREELLEQTGLDADYLDRIMWMLDDQGVFAGELYISGPGTGAVDLAVQGTDPWWVDAMLTDHGRQLFEQMR